MNQRVTTVIGVPGHWTDRSEIVKSVVSHGDGYLLVGTILMKTGSKKGFTVEIYERDPNLSRAFSVAGRGRLTDDILAAIDSHTNCLYLVADGGSVEVAKSLLHAANALLKSGGLAVKVESTGTAHRPDQWANFCAHDDDLHSLVRAYVTLVGYDKGFYSCGMHNLGLRDAILQAELSPEEAASLLDKFLVYSLRCGTIKDRDTFSTAPDAPHYRIVAEPCELYRSPDNIFHNPFGMWAIRPK